MKHLLFFFFCTTQSILLFSQGIGDYRSNGTGDWNAVTTWQRFDGYNWVAAVTPPSSADGAITIRSPHTVTANTDVTADELVVESGATLNIPNTIANNTFTLADGGGTDDLSVDGLLQLGATLNGPGTVYIPGEMQWTAGTIDARLSIVLGGVLTISSGSPKTLKDVLTISGSTANWQDGSIYLENGTLRIGGIFTNSFNGNLIDGGGTNLVSVYASSSFRKTAGSGTTYIQVPLDNAGTLNVASGTIENSNTLTNTGIINIDAGALFRNNATVNFNSGTSFSGSGTLELQNGTHNVSAMISTPSTLVVALSSGNLTGSGSLTVNGTMLWTSGTVNVPLTIAGGGILTMNGGFQKNLKETLTIGSSATAKWQDGAIVMDNCTLLINGTFTNSFDGNIIGGVGTNTVTNNGIFQKTGGTGLTSVQVPFTNNNIIKGIQTISFDAPFNNAGSINPGLGIGIQAVNSTVSPLFTTNSSLNIEIFSGDGPGIGHDQLQRSGNLVLNGTLNVTETGIVPSGTYTIVSLTSGIVSGSFTTVNLPPGYVVGTTSTTVFITKTVLPVHLVDFALKKIDQHSIELNWNTALEFNSAYFIIERSNDGVRFAEIGRLNAVGNSNGITNYRFADYEVAKRINYYRLKQVDRDGSYSFSKVISAKFDDTESIIIVLNPVKNNLQMVSAPFEKMAIIDLQGRVLKHFAYSSSQLYDVSSIPAGIYLVLVFNNNRTTTLRMKKE